MDARRKSTLVRLLILCLVVALFAAVPVGYRLGYGTARRYAKTKPAPWRVAGTLPSSRLESPPILIGDELYVFGGFDGYDLETTKSVEKFDLADKSVSRLADLPTGVTHVQAALVDGSVWIAGGFDGNHPGIVTDATHVYDLATDRWRGGPALPSPRASGALVAVGSRLHYFGGLVDRNENGGEHWVLDTENLAAGWNPRASMPNPRAHFAAMLIDGRVYAIGGQFHHDTGRQDLAFCDVYDPENDTWSALPPIPEPTSHHEASTFERDGLIVVLGGRNDSPHSYLAPPPSNRRMATSLGWVYDIKTSEWRRGPNLPLGLLGGFAVPWNDKIVLGGGSSYDSRFPQRTIYALDLREADPL